MQLEEVCLSCTMKHFAISSQQEADLKMSISSIAFGPVMDFRGSGLAWTDLHAMGCQPRLLIQ